MSGHNGTNGHVSAPLNGSGVVNLSKAVNPDCPESETPLENTFVYGKYLSKSLRETVESFRKQTYQLHEEIALTRMVLVDSLKAYNFAYNVLELNPTDIRASEMLQVAGAMLVNAIKDVRDICMAAHRVSGNATLDPGMVQQLIFQVVKVVDVETQRIAPALEQAGIDPQDYMDRINQGIDMRALSSPAALGTDLTPEQLDEEIQAMHDTVPGVA